MFSTLPEAKVLVEEYRNHYNGERPHSTQGCRTLAEFGAVVRAGVGRRGSYEGTRIANCALVATGTECRGRLVYLP